MKNIIERLIVESKDWEIASNKDGQDFSYSPDKKYLWINTEGQEIGFMTAKDIKSWEDEDMVDVQDILNLKPGEMIDADGGINLYVRIK